MTEEDQVKRLVIFAILMENGVGIATKSQEYVMEKFLTAMMAPYPEEMLDPGNKHKLKRWCRRWRA